MKTWTKIKWQTHLEPGTIIGGWNDQGEWKRARVTETMSVVGVYLIGLLEATHFTEAAAPWDIPRAPRMEECETMEPAW